MVTRGHIELRLVPTHLSFGDHLLGRSDDPAPVGQAAVTGLCRPPIGVYHSLESSVSVRIGEVRVP